MAKLNETRVSGWFTDHKTLNKILNKIKRIDISFVGVAFFKFKLIQKNRKYLNLTFHLLWNQTRVLLSFDLI